MAPARVTCSIILAAMVTSEMSSLVVREMSTDKENPRTCSYSKSDKKMDFSLSHILVKDMQKSVMPPPWQTVTSSRREHASYSNKRARIEDDNNEEMGYLKPLTETRS
ncbi:hypothetical protein M0802_013098 [Mischocyttarus mexicanus]|nr:hypothetical protein M0802_013098 [Mischocyttarus mexicanus]